MRHSILGLAAVVVLVGAHNARGEMIFLEDFQDSSGFTIDGGYQEPWIQWGIAPLSGTPTYPSSFVQGGTQSGTIFYGAYAREYRTAPAATMTMILPDLTWYTDLQLTVALAAAENIWEPTHRDSLHIIGGTTTSAPFVDNPGGGAPPPPGAIDSFLPLSYPDSLRSSVYSTSLGVVFQDLTYPIAGDLKSLTFAFASTAGDECVGIDSVTITGNPIPEPSTLAIWSLLGALGAAVGRRRRRSRT
jgi:hypothetical protein